MIWLALVWVSGCAWTLQNTAGPPSVDSSSKSDEPNPVSRKRVTIEDLKKIRPPVAKESIHLTDTPQGQSLTVADGKSRPTPPPASATEDAAASEVKSQSTLDEALDFCQVSQDFWQKGELENALEALDRAYSLILEVDTYDNPKLIQQKEDLRFMISKRILEIYASRNIVVNGAHKAIPLTMNRHVQAEIDSFTSEKKEKKFFVASYKRSGLYRPYIVQQLKLAGLPEELSWLPLIESGFKVNALSRARALGLWQFISSTGYKFGLKRDQFIDERLDPEKATLAAIAYLKELHQIFGDWTTVLAAYNCGEGRVLRVIRSQNVNYLDNFWDLYRRLPRETARYVPRFIATLHILRDPKRYGLDKVEPLPSLTFDRVTVSRSLHLKEIAKAIGASESEMRLLNPELRVAILPHEEYALRVPPGKADLLLAKLDSIPKYTHPVNSYAYYRVRRGDTLSTIAARYHTSVGNIMRANNLRKSHYIVAGKTLKIPQRGSQPAATAAKSSSASRTQHVVRRGDSLWIIARRYGTTVKQIQATNHLPSTRLHIGQVLQIPGRQSAAATTTTGNDYKTYTVKRGDSPFKIAQAHNMSLQQFLRINSLTPRSTIYPGQSLNVK
jgi:membrane-bound lytic murein transglycosylase D